MRHQVEQGHASNEFKSQEYYSNQADTIQGIQLRVDSMERNVRKCSADQEVSKQRHCSNII